MIWGAHEVDGRLAAKHAIKIQAALRQSVDPAKIYEEYLHTHPVPTKNVAQDRARARAWAMVHVHTNKKPLEAVLRRVWAEGYVTGLAAAQEAVAKAVKAKKSSDPNYVDWQHWNPGDKASAALLRPSGALERILQGAGQTIAGIVDSTQYDRIGTALADSLQLGLSPDRSAKLIQDSIASPARALTISITEQNRAMSQASLDKYSQMGLEQVEWSGADPCEICAENDGQVVGVGENFRSGDDAPPAHPNCRCALLPVIPEAYTMPEETAFIPEGDTGGVETSAPVEITSSEFAVGGWTKIDSQAARRQQVIDSYTRGNPHLTPEQVAEFVDSKRISRVDLEFIKKADVRANGNTQIQFSYGGNKVPEADRAWMTKAVEELQMTAFKNKMTITVNKENASAYGSAIRGNEHIWIAPKTAMDDKPNLIEGGSFKMPTLRTFSQREYTLAHEWGHALDTLPEIARDRLIMEAKSESQGKPGYFASRYSGKNNAEFYAEMFAEWYLTAGQTENPLVLAMAGKFGWGNG
jgi:SPP1 gp7 family putative phage head morphogenesis protein